MIFEKCSICGKKTLAIFLNSGGICKYCMQKTTSKETEKIIFNPNVESVSVPSQSSVSNNSTTNIINTDSDWNDSMIYLNDIANMYSDVLQKLSYDDPDKILDVLPKITEKEHICDAICKKLSDYKSYTHLEDILSSKITYKTDSDKNLNIGHIEPFNFIIWTSKSDKPLINQFINSLDTNCKQLKNGWIKTYLKFSAYSSFAKQLLTIEPYSIVLSPNNKTKTLYLNDKPEYKHSSVTAKSNYTKLGSFIVIDTETTGLSNVQNEIIELAAIKFVDWEPIQKFETFIKPKKSIPSNISKLTGITNEMVENSPEFYEIIPSFIEFIGSSPIIGHNLEFDINFLWRKGCDILTTKRKYYDTLELAQKILKIPKKKWDKELESYEIDYEREYDVDDYKLETLCQYYNIRDNSTAHRALSDCLATGLLFQKLVKERVTTSS